MSSAIASATVLDSLPDAELPPSLAPANCASPSVVKRVAPRDPLKMLASFIAQSLMDKMGDQASQTLLVGLFGSASQRRKRGLSIARLIDQYLDHAESYYRHADGSPTGETPCIRHAMVVLRKMFGRTAVEDFRPLKLKAVREEMVQKVWCRKTVNAAVGRIKRMFKWGVENELVPADRHHALQAVSGLKIGRTTARESEPVKPVPEELVTAVLPHVSAQVAAMIRLQLLTGMRPGEVLTLRTCDIDRSDEIWFYQPAQHKTAHHAHTRQIFIGPQAQQIVTPYLRDDASEKYLFSAADAEEEWRRQRHEARKTPMNEGNSPGTNRKRRPKRRPGDKYDRNSYARAISRACEVAFPVPAQVSDEEAKKWRRAHHWHPHQLRHNTATKLRKLYGIDVAQIILGHKTLAVTAIYAERDTKAAVEIMKQIG